MNTIIIPKILLPQGCDMQKWAVNACDQFTSDYNYWRDVENMVNGGVSSFNLIFPEIYLKDEPTKRISRINNTMREYLLGGVFRETEGFILVERTTQSGTRTGIVLAIDLEDYSYNVGDKALIRSTEATILERIPPRVEIRKNAPIELPHIMLLYDDESNSVLKSVKRGEVLYDFELMKNGGKVKGTKIENAEEIKNAFYALCSSERCARKYGSEDKLLFTVGDGNHSLATAKTCWENIKKGLSQTQIRNHLARYALVEVVNIHDAALTFEPIHRFIKCANPENFKREYKPFGGNRAYIVIDGKKEEIKFNENVPLGIRELDERIKDFTAENGGEVDYIHGDEDLVNLTKDGGVGVILPPIAKSDFFRLIINGGNLPKKTFSMGEGNEKRYYIEARAVVE